MSLHISQFSSRTWPGPSHSAELSFSFPGASVPRSGFTAFGKVGAGISQPPSQSFQFASAAFLSLSPSAGLTVTVGSPTRPGSVKVESLATSRFREPKDEEASPSNARTAYSPKRPSAPTPDELDENAEDDSDMPEQSASKGAGGGRERFLVQQL